MNLKKTVLFNILFFLGVVGFFIVLILIFAYFEHPQLFRHSLKSLILWAAAAGVVGYVIAVFSTLLNEGRSELFNFVFKLITGKD